MYIESMTIKNYRRFNDENNTILFSNFNSKQDPKVSKSTTLLMGKNNTGKSTIVDLLDKLSRGDNLKAFSVDDLNAGYLHECFKESLNYVEGVGLEAPYFSVEIKFIVQEIELSSVTNFSDLIVIEDVMDENIEKLEVVALAKYECQNYQKYLDNIKKINEILNMSINSADSTFIKKLSEMKVSLQMVKNFEDDFETFREVLENEDLKDEQLKYQEYLKINLFNQYVEAVKDTSYTINYYPEDSEEKAEDFSMENLLEVKMISANNVTNDKSLTKSYNKIIEAFFNENPADLQSTVTDINYNITGKVEENYTQKINRVVHEIESTNHVNMNLQSSVTIEKLLNNFVEYYYQEGNYFFPQSQYGLGYTNLMVIISELVEYMQSYDKEHSTSKVNIVCIEEPETFMHPQMQELFINNIEQAIEQLASDQNEEQEESDKQDIEQTTFRFNFQLVITTHSAHIVNSKIQTSNSFNDINYMYTNGSLGSTQIAPIQDEKILKDTSDREEMLTYVKKHMRLDNSDIFFADAVIFVEGGTEEHYIKYRLSVNEELSKHYISIINVNGAHAKAYFSLCEIMNIPTVIYTDIDYDRQKESNAEGKEEEKFEQLSDLTADNFKNPNKISTNSTIKAMTREDITKEVLIQNAIEDKEEHQEYFIFKKGTIKCFTQGYCNGYYATSFEEAIILENYDKELIHDALKEARPGIYNTVLGENPSQKNNLVKENSYRFQKKLGNEKRTFINYILFEEITENESLDLPKYIQAGFDYLIQNLKDGGE